MQSQFDFGTTVSPTQPAPSAGSRRTDPELEAAAIRASMTLEEISAERQLLTDRGNQRYHDGDRTGLGGPRGHQGCGSAFFVFDWMTDDEVARFHALGLAMPTSGELVEAARQRIMDRIAMRRRLKSEVAECA
jgi:hypothetical protein